MAYPNLGTLLDLAGAALLSASYVAGDDFYAGRAEGVSFEVIFHRATGSPCTGVTCKLQVSPHAGDEVQLVRGDTGDVSATLTLSAAENATERMIIQTPSTKGLRGPFRLLVKAEGANGVTGDTCTIAGTAVL